ncbi:MAG: MTH1187 family thiamine-binding protein [Burkholderiaceae bacterium]|nr:MTH1187 family thiamine-binding protein [Burkholderiaceae bacterium]
MVLLELQIYPNDKGVNLSAYVARCMDIIDKSGVTYLMNPMGTILEGSWDEVMAVVTACFKDLERDCDRISTNIKIDYRAGDKSRLKSKITSVENVLGRTLTT